MWKKFILMFVIMLSTAFMFQSCETEEVVSPPPTEIVQYVEANYPDAEIVIVKYDKRDKELMLFFQMVGNLLSTRTLSL